MLPVLQPCCTVSRSGSPENGTTVQKAWIPLADRFYAQLDREARQLRCFLLTTCLDWDSKSACMLRVVTLSPLAGRML